MCGTAVLKCAKIEIEKLCAGPNVQPDYSNCFFLASLCLTLSQVGRWCRFGNEELNIYSKYEFSNIIQILRTIRYC